MSQGYIGTLWKEIFWVWGVSRDQTREESEVETIHDCRKRCASAKWGQCQTSQSFKISSADSIHRFNGPIENKVQNPIGASFHVFAVMNSFTKGFVFVFADDGRPSLDIWKIVGPFFDNFCIGKFPPFENPIFSVSVGLAYSFWTELIEKKKNISEKPAWEKR